MFHAFCYDKTDKKIFYSIHSLILPFPSEHFIEFAYKVEIDYRAIKLSLEHLNGEESIALSTDENRKNRK